MMRATLQTWKGCCRAILILGMLIQGAATCPGEESLEQESGQFDLQENILFAREDGHILLLDLYKPINANKPLPLVVWIHGGGWQAGNKKNCPAKVLTHDGFAVASINYRLTSQATFPAQIHDCKGAIRFLRSSARTFGIDPNAIGVWGGSAGGSLAALVGTSGKVAFLEGDVGGNLDCSSEVQAVCDWFGRKHFMAFADPNAYDTPRLPRVEALFTGTVDQKKQLAKAISPLTHIDRNDPPFLIMHGRLDPVVAVGESEDFFKALKKAGVSAELIVLEEAGHGFPDPKSFEPVRDFFVKHLKAKAANP
ncbi:MAG TPA: alpha/beta hydrolase [Anaerohalosphaeraceae bacterium]|nr:alpha/beta hydrolase [Anaerohalosphaeraceae bacterium]